MIFKSAPSLRSPLPTQWLSLSLPEQRQSLGDQLTACRASLLRLVSSLTVEEYFRQSHPDFSPVGWHLGHIAFTEGLWILEHLAQQTAPCPEYRRLFAADGLPKAERQNLPDIPAVLDYLAVVREQVWTYLITAPVAAQGRIWWWLLQHESQHAETLSIVLAMHRRKKGRISARASTNQSQTMAAAPRLAEMVYLPEAQGCLGYDGIDAIDNEQPGHPVEVAAFWLDPYPVTVGEYRRFMRSGGYDHPDWWTPEGWAWLQANPVRQPLYWPGDRAWDDHPVCGVSWYEADAYARFVGKRLPTEAEWERAALWPLEMGQPDKPSLYPWGELWPTPQLCNHHYSVGFTSPVGAYPGGKTASGCFDLLGNVWEWTGSWFEAYPDFSAFPYRGYSAAYFDRQHRVLRGGSWATFPWALRGTFRNWYHPDVRQIFAGFRCARSA